VATFGDALRRLTDQATHLYVDGRRYWYSTQPSVTRLAQDRAAQQDNDKVLDEIKRRLREAAGKRGDFARVHPCPGSSGDVPDDPEARLVILGPDHPHSARMTDSPARKEAGTILEQRGPSRRENKNMLVFLAADRTRLSELDQAVRLYLAWKSIVDETIPLNLDPFQANQAKTKCAEAEDTAQQRIPETYVWLLAPGQGKWDPNGRREGNRDPNAPVDWQEIRLQGQDALAVRASKKLKTEELLLTEFAGTRLRLELDRIPLWDGDHVSLKQLASYFAKYLYLPRLKDSDVLLASVRDGLHLLTWQQESFAYADGWDADQKRYRGLKVGSVGGISLASDAVLVKPDVAVKQMEQDAAKRAASGGSGTSPDSGLQPHPPTGGAATGTQPEPKAVPEALPRRFHGSKQLDPMRLSRDAGQVADEVVQHITKLVGAKVDVTLEIRADIPEGAPESVIRTVTENCRTLHFKDHGFEEK
jgi:hypothetical protein